MGFLGILLFFGTASLTFTSAVDNDSLLRDQGDDGREIIKLSNALSAGLRGPEANGPPLEQSWSRSLKNKRSHRGINHGGEGGGGGDRGDRGRSNRDDRGRRGNGNGGGRDRAGGGRRGDRGRTRGDPCGDGQSVFTCKDGILQDGYCCSKTCGVGGCGGVGCRRRNGLRTADDCCFSRITDLCSLTGCAPCKMDGECYCCCCRGCCRLVNTLRPFRRSSVASSGAFMVNTVHLRCRGGRRTEQNERSSLCNIICIGDDVVTGRWKVPLLHFMCSFCCFL
ncbi:unnamed protein product [Ectocarpus sp. 8 AP-2014]